MSETNAAPPAAPVPPAPLVVNIQYVKDLSFEVPNAPQVYATLRAQPQVAINLDVQVRRLQDGQDVFEVTLAVKAEAHEPATNGAAPAVVFIAELAYAGVFTLNGIPEASVEPVLVVECPRLLFPYARNILADITRDGGFPPVLLQPIDFLQLWQARQAQGQTANA
jgi:preprotein translocase subunit SecB